MTLAAADHLVDPDIARAETLPPSAFTDPAFLELELRTLFARSWLLVPPAWGAPASDDTRSLAELVAVRGAHAPFTLLGRPLYLQRDWEGVLRAFPNVCTHAWHTLVDGPGRARTVICPQHGRTFDCEGRFVGQQGFSKDTLPGFPRPCDHLQALPVGEWGPLLFVAPGAPGRAFDAWLAPVRETTAGLGLDAMQRRAHGAEVREVEGNWKLHAWNYMDTFHITFVHRAPGGLADAIDMSSYRTELFDGAALQWAYAKDPRDGFDPARLPARFRDPARPERRVFALWWLLFPNVTLNFYPWGLSINAYEPVPGRPERTLFSWHHLVADEAQYARREEGWLSHQVDAEDVLAIKQVRRGVASGLAPRGRFAPGAEQGPHWFHRAVYEAVFGK
ncbi:MAG: Rieske 2Fe-2S domain-containing protein [Planctomycetes bacterium]|nr:Rieske 2Fe-2S domain-containing protein [Planctomycetota bacterium]